MIKMFALDKAFMFRFESEPGHPANDNHKIVPTYRSVKQLGLEEIKSLVKRFLSTPNIQWRDLGGSLGAIYYSSAHKGIGLSANLVLHLGNLTKVVWVLTQEDIDEINGVSSEGNHRASLRRTKDVG